MSAAKEGYAITNFGVALGQVVEKTKLKWYDDQNIGKDERLKLDSSRPKSQNLSDVELLTDTQGLFKLDAEIADNRNTGHIFTDEDVS